MSLKFEFTPRDDSRKRPPAFTKCVDCGCCYADLYAVNDPICWACDAGEPCKAKLQPKYSPPQPQPAAQPAPSVQEKPMGIASTRNSKSRISGEVKAAILAEAPTVSNTDLARKYGISDPTVCQWRKAAGIVLVKGPRSPKAAASAAVKKSSAVNKSNSVKVSAAKSFAAGMSASEQAASTVSITLNFTPEQLDAIWNMLPVEVKVVAVTAALQAKVEAA